MKTRSLIANADVNLVIGDRPQELRSITKTAGKMQDGLMITIAAIGLAIGSLLAPSAHAQDIQYGVQYQNAAPQSAQSQDNRYQDNRVQSDQRQDVQPVTSEEMAQRRYEQSRPANVVTVQVLGVSNMRISNNGDPRQIVGQAQQSARYQTMQSAGIGAVAGTIAGAMMNSNVRGYNGHRYHSSYKQHNNMALGALLGTVVGASVGRAEANGRVQRAGQQASDSIGRMQQDDYLTNMRVARQVQDQYGVRTEVFQITVPYTPVRPGDRLDLVQDMNGRWAVYNTESPVRYDPRQRRGY